MDTSATQCRLHWNPVRNNSQIPFLFAQKKFQPYPHLPSFSWSATAHICTAHPRGNASVNSCPQNPSAPLAGSLKHPAHVHTALNIYIKLGGQHTAAGPGISHTL